MTIFIVTVVLFVAWWALGLLGSAYGYNYLQLKYPLTEELMNESAYRFALKMSLAGPINLLGVVSQGMTTYGPRFRRYKYIDGKRV